MLAARRTGTGFRLTQFSWCFTVNPSQILANDPGENRMNKTLVLCALSLVLTVTSCAWWDGWSTKNEEYNQLIAQAGNEVKLADKTGFLWNNTEQCLKDSKEAKAAADKAMTDGDSTTAKNEFDKAMKLAQQAMKQAQLAQQQARDNANPVAKYQ